MKIKGTDKYIDVGIPADRICTSKLLDIGAGPRS
jgi:hypothetical protein